VGRIPSETKRLERHLAAAADDDDKYYYYY
jgi:hypothetical protein